jgi:signal transduction histidine kinase
VSTDSRSRAPSAPAPVPPATRLEIIEFVVQQLCHLGNPVVASPTGIERLRTRIGAVLDDVACRVAHPRMPRILVGRRQSTIGPDETVRAADWFAVAAVLFQVALPILARALDMPDPDQVVALATTLNASVITHIGTVAAGDLDGLIHRVRSVQVDEGRRVARELHDRAAHGIGVALQSLDLYDLYAGVDPQQASARLNIARDSLRDAIATVMKVTTEVRDILGNRRLDQALETCLTRYAPPGTHTSIDVVGDAAALPPAIREELYLVLREAIHNAVLHARAGRIAVRVEIGTEKIVAEVVDDGIGFEPSLTFGIGMASMRERLELFGGALHLSSSSGSGSTVRATIPLTA